MRSEKLFPSWLLYRLLYWARKRGFDPHRNPGLAGEPSGTRTQDTRIKSLLGLLSATYRPCSETSVEQGKRHYPLSVDVRPSAPRNTVFRPDCCIDCCTTTRVASTLAGRSETLVVVFGARGPPADLLTKYLCICLTRIQWKPIIVAGGENDERRRYSQD